MTKPDIWMPLYVSDYLADTMHLSRDQHGAYLLLLMAAWMGNGRLPDDDRALAAITKSTPKEWKSLRSALAPFFVINQGVWTQKRLMVEIEAAKERKAKATAKALAGAKKRWNQTVDNPVDNYATSIAQALPEGGDGQSPKVSTAPASISITGVTPTDSARATSHGEGDKDPLKSKTTGNGAWRRDADGAARKAETVGLRARPGESIGELVRRVDVAIALRDRDSAGAGCSASLAA